MEYIADTWKNVTPLDSHARLCDYALKIIKPFTSSREITDFLCPVSSG